MNRFSKRLQFPFDITNKVYQLIVDIEKIKDNLIGDRRFGKGILKKLKQSVLVTSTGASNRIEGNKMNDEEVEALYRNMRMKKFRNRDEQEVGGYLEVLELIFSSYDTMVLGENLILELHQRMLNYSNKDIAQRGKYKFGPNRVEARDEEGNLVQVIFNPTEPALVKLEIQDLIYRTKEELIKKEIQPLLVIANFIFEFLAIHPFQDGNGRMSRILTNMLLLQSGFHFTSFVSHESIIEANKIEYYIALNKTQQSRKTETEDMSKWILFFLKVVKQQAEKALIIYSKDNIEVDLSQIQLKIWNIIIEKDLISRKELCQLSGISYNTIGQVINKLVYMKKIERVGNTAGTKYRIIIGKDT